MILKIWLIGIVVTCITSFITRLEDDYYNDDVKIWLCILITFCIITVGGITAGRVISVCVYLSNINWSSFIFIIFVLIIIYGVGFGIVGIYTIRNMIAQICFIVIFIISVIGWTIPFYNDEKMREENTESITETIVQTEERQLTSFCELPVQAISGSVEGSSFLGTGTVSGSIWTADELSYWYVDELGESNYASAPATNSKLIFFNDNTIMPHVEIITTITQTKVIHHYDGTEYTTIEGESTVYRFYLPETMKAF